MSIRKHFVGLAAIAGFGLLGQAAHASNIPFLDTFDTFAGGSTGSNFTTGTASWTVLNGSNVDLIGASQFTAWNVHCLGGQVGGCIDLDGSNITNTGAMIVSDSFNLIAGHQYTLSAYISGNQRGNSLNPAAAMNPDSVTMAFVTPGTFTTASSLTVSGLAPSQDFQLFSFNYTATSTGPVSIGFWDNQGSASDSFGALIDNVAVNDTTPVPLPASAWLLLSGLLGLGFFSRRNGGQALLRA